MRSKQIEYESNVTAVLFFWVPAYVLSLNKADGTVAYVAVKKSVVLKAKNLSGIEVMDATHIACVSAYRKAKGNWLPDAMASINT